MFCRQFLLWDILLYFSPCIPPLLNHLLRVFSNIDLSWEVQHSCQDLVLGLPISHILPSNEPQQTSSFIFLKGPQERKVMSISSPFCNIILICSYYGSYGILFFLSMLPPICYQWGPLISCVKLGCKLSQACAILCVCITLDSRVLNVMGAKSILGLLLCAAALQTITTIPSVIRTHD